MSPRLSAVAAVALLFCTGWKAVLAQTAETAGVNLADPRNARWR